MQSLGSAVDDRPHPLNVRIPTPLGATVGVAHVHAERWLLATEIAHCCHWRTFLGEAAVDGPRRPSRTAQRLASPAMTSSATLGADDLRSVMGGYRDALRLHQADINRLNVYPVPDGDTGTNMALTLEAVVSELEGVDPAAGLAEVCKAIGHGSLMGARGNSGVILSQLLRGMSERMGAAGAAGGGRRGGE